MGRVKQYDMEYKEQAAAEFGLLRHRHPAF